MIIDTGIRPASKRRGWLVPVLAALFALGAAPSSSAQTIGHDLMEGRGRDVSFPVSCGADVQRAAVDIDRVEGRCSRTVDVQRAFARAHAPGNARGAVGQRVEAHGRVRPAFARADAVLSFTCVQMLQTTKRDSSLRSSKIFEPNSSKL